MTLQSKPGQTVLLAVVCAAIGFLLMYAARNYPSLNSNQGAGFMLGVILFVLGALGIAIREKRRVDLDEKRRQIVLEVTRSLGGNKRIVIPFSQITGFGIGLQGRPSSGTRYYDLTVETRDGKEIHLFGGCVFEGRMDRNWIDDLRRRFEQAVGSA